MVKNERERGSVLIMVVLALGTFVFGAIGLGIDGANLYAQRQLAQSAADAVAQAAMSSVFNHTNARGLSSDFSTAGPLTCAPASDETPCRYARSNGVGATARDTVLVTFFSYAQDARPDLGRLSADSPNLTRATVSRDVDTTLMRWFGTNFTQVTAIGEAAILESQSPTPILILHPSEPESLELDGGTSIRVCGGPSRSVQVNSWDGAAYAGRPASVSDWSDPRRDVGVVLSRAGTADSGNCDTGTGADFGVFGGPGSSTAGDTVLVGTTGDYNYPSGVIEDPYKDVDPPAQPGTNGTQTALSEGFDAADLVHPNRCPIGVSKPCTLYTPGFYTNGIDVKNETAFFSPGIYYMGAGKGFQSGANGIMYMCPRVYCGTADPVTQFGMLVYNSAGGTFEVGANGNVDLVGTPSDSVYKGILFFQDRNSPAATGAGSHDLGGGGDMSLEGTIYLTNSVDTMLDDPNHYQEVKFHGNPGSATYIHGDIVVDLLHLVGGSHIAMELDPTRALYIRQLALVR